MKPGRNDPCPCGSGKKYKNCCLGEAPSSPPSRRSPPANELSQIIKLYNTARHGELEDRARALLEQYPDSGMVWKLFGLALHMQGKEALPALHKAADLLPDDAEAHANLAAVLRVFGKLDDAVASGRRAVQINPNFAQAHNNLGVALKDLKQFDEAVVSYRHAIKINPGFTEAHNNLGAALQDMWQLDDAADSYRRALSLKPDFAEAHNNLGGVLNDLGQADEAVASYRRALAIKPDFTDAYSSLLFSMNYSPRQTPAAYLAEARRYGQMVASKVDSKFTTWLCATNPTRLRIGLVSGDLHQHPVGHFLESLLAHIDPARIELMAYPTRLKEDALTARIKPHFAAWKPLLGLKDQAAARLIHADGVHILIDLAGHSAHNRLPLFAWKPAPVQFSWIGFPATTGVAEMDYVLGDPIATPVEDEGHFSERVWRLPESYLCLTPPDVMLDVSPLPALSSGLVTFASFNNLSKMSDATVALWARVLQAVPGSRLLLKTRQLQDATVLATTIQRFAAHGIVQERLLLQGLHAPQRIDHLAAYQGVDIALDTFPYRGVTTSVEALWMGVPVLTLHGDRFLSRTADSIAHNAGLDDWIAADEEDYVAKAVAHSTDLQRLAALRATLRQQVLASPLFDVARFARNFEAALWGMWQA